MSNLKVVMPVFLTSVLFLPARLDSQDVRTLSFEVASVKSNKSESGSFMVGCYFPNSRTGLIPKGMCIASNASLRSILSEAYGLEPFSLDSHLIGGPGWIATERFDIEAKAENPETRPEDLRTMLRTLLAERFKLKVHEETKEVSGLRLIVAKNGPKLKPATEGGGSYVKAYAGSVGLRPVELEAVNASMADLVRALRGVKTPVVDMTGLTGHYDFKVLMPDDEDSASTAPHRSGGRTAVSINDASLPVFGTAIQEQLGLKLESQKVPVTVLVIDQVQRPTTNAPRH